MTRPDLLQPVRAKMAGSQAPMLQQAVQAPGDLPPVDLQILLQAIQRQSNQPFAAGARPGDAHGITSQVGRV